MNGPKSGRSIPNDARASLRNSQRENFQEEKMKITVIYHSETGNTKKMADYLVEGLQAVGDIEAKAFSIDGVDKDFAKESKAVILGSPVYAGTISAKTKMWLERESKDLQLAGKLTGAFATARFIHGGGDVAILSILNHFLVFGALVYSSGAAKGQPVIHYGPVALGDNPDAYADLFKTYGQRMAEKAKELF